MPIKSANYYQTLTVEDMDIEIQGNCKENKRENQFEKGFVPQRRPWKYEILLEI